MATTARRLTDDQLASTDLRIADPTKVDRYTRDRPDQALAPEIIGEYDLTPPGGMRANPDGPWVWCCHCQKDNHWRGFVIANATGNRYSVGNDCAAKYYGIEFSSARRTFKDEVTRKGLLERLGALSAAAEGIYAVIAEALHSSSLSMIDAKRKEIGKACANAAFLLSSAAHSGTPLHEQVQVRDLAAELARDDKLPADADRPPIYKLERRAIGLIDGSAVVRNQDDCRDRLLSLRRAVRQVRAMHKGDTDAVTTETMKKLVVEAESAHRAAEERLAEYRRAPDFFSATNVDRMARWSDSQSGFTIRPNEDGIEIITSTKSAIVRRFDAISLPRLPQVTPLAPRGQT